MYCIQTQYKSKICEIKCTKNQIPTYIQNMYQLDKICTKCKLKKA